MQWFRVVDLECPLSDFFWYAHKPSGEGVYKELVTSGIFMVYGISRENICITSFPLHAKFSNFSLALAAIVTLEAYFERGSFGLLNGVALE